MGFFSWQKTNQKSQKETASNLTVPVKRVRKVKRVPKSPIVQKISGAHIKNVIAEVANRERPSGEKIVETKQIVTFELDKEEYASPITDLKEIIRIPDIVSVPGAHPFVKGIFNLRGQVVTVIDLEKRFQLVREHPATQWHIIIVEQAGSVFGMIVDEVTGVLRVPVTNIKPAPTAIASKIQADYITGVVVLDDSTQLTGEENVEEQEEKIREKQEKAVSKRTARMILLLDLPKMLQEQELTGFGEAIDQTVKETAEKQ